LVLPEFSARAVSLQVIEHLERRRQAIASHPAAIADEVKRAMSPVRKAYLDYELPHSYLDALESELMQTLPAQWQAVAEPYTRLESLRFKLWRGGDVIARIAYVFLGLTIGGLILEAPFIPIWEKWFPFVLAIFAWWLPDVQVRFHRRRYARELGTIVTALERAQPALDQNVTIGELLPPGEKLEAKHE
jgi:hypothetical protein